MDALYYKSVSDFTINIRILEMDQHRNDISPDLVYTLDDTRTSKMTSTTSMFLMRISDIYGASSPFLAADCASRAISLNSLSKCKNAEISSQKLERFRKSLCSRCKTQWIVGRTATLGWRSSRSSIDGSRNMKRRSRRSTINGSSSIGLPQLMVVCSTCYESCRVSINGWVRRYDRLDNGSRSNPIENQLIESMSSTRKKKRPRKDVNAGLRLNIGKAIIDRSTDRSTDRSINDRSIDRSTDQSDRRPMKKTKWTPISRPPQLQSGVRKRNLKSKLDKLLIDQETNKRSSYASTSALSSFLESL